MRLAGRRRPARGRGRRRRAGPAGVRQHRCVPGGGGRVLLGRGQGDDVPHGHRGSRPDQPGPAGVLRRRAAGEHAGRGLGARAAGVPDRGRGRGRPVRVSLDPYNALITRVEPDPEVRPGPLSGRRLLVKDLIDTAGIRTTYGSRIYGDHVPERTAPAVQRLLDAGAVLVGKANLPEFAWAVMGQNPFYGTVHNPAAPGKTTGGSSAGNAAALAADMCDIGLGTDTGCSIRLPSACCETVGLKPRWGSIEMNGVFPLCPTLDTVGPMARSVADVALMWSVLTGKPVPEPRLEGLAVGLLRQPPTV